LQGVLVDDVPDDASHEEVKEQVVPDNHDDEKI
jgi:hypothetical protein